jgi:selenocysteine-specific elongation factor
LVKALTGTDTDRLKEEKLRGITIELGFASLDLPSGQHIGIVDVPGHEKFVKNMVAGATGIDIVAMIIAADEGVMPQTREHMEICSLLKIKHGLIVLTKVDLVDEEWLELVKEDIRAFIKESFLDGAPIVPVSASTGRGIPDLIETLEALSRDIPERISTGLFRLPVDRVFSMKGFGTVITGTLSSGQVSVDETIMIYPSRATSKVRGIQVHNESLQTAYAGMRTAINFQGLDKASVNRGDLLSSPDALKPSYLLDASISYLKSNAKPAKNRTRVRFHTGTVEIMGNLILLDQETLKPGENGFIQLRLDAPVTCVKNDRFVLRSFSPVRTIGGGEILNPLPPKHKRFKPEVIEGLEILTADEPDKTVSFFASHAGFSGVSFADLKIMTNLPEKRLNLSLQGLMTSRTLLQIDKEARIFLHKDNLDELTALVREHLSKYHKTNPLKGAMPRAELLSKLPKDVSTKLFNLMLNQMVKEQEVVQEEDSVRLFAHKVALQVEEADVKRKIEQTYLKEGLSPPFFREMVKTLDMDQKAAMNVLMLLINEGRIVRTKDDLYFHVDHIERLKEQVTAFLLEKGELSTAAFKDIVNVSRKYIIPLIEYLDSIHLTIRVGDMRQLRKKS